VRVDAQGHGRVRVAKAGGHDVDWDSSKQQRGRVQVMQIMQAGVGQRLVGRPDCLVVRIDQLGHQRGHGVRVERFAPLADEDQAAGISPIRCCCQPLFCLTAAVFSQYGHGFDIDADHPGPAALVVRVNNTIDQRLLLSGGIATTQQFQQLQKQVQTLEQDLKVRSADTRRTP
jgi:hypothetical protein